MYFQCDVNLITLLIMSFEDIKLRCLLYVHEGGNAVEIKTEADGNDMTECSHDDMSSAGVFHFPDSIFSAFILLPPTKEEVYVFACICLSVCLCSRLHKNACMDLVEMLCVDKCRYMDELINF